MQNTDETSAARKILILGGGFGGLYTLQHLLKRLKKSERPDITLVNDQNHFLFSPILHEAAAGVIDLSHITYPIRKMGDNRLKFIMAEALKIEPDKHRVITSVGTLDYDCLVIALGSVTIMPEIPYDERPVYTLKTLKDTTLFKNHLIRIFEEASSEQDPERVRQLLTIVISGGGYTGVQLAATLQDVLLKYYTKYFKSVNRDDINIILIEAEEEIVRNLQEASRKYIRRRLEHSGARILSNSRITKISKDAVVVNGKDTILTDTLVWVTGVKANPCVAEMNVEKDDLGRVGVNDYLQLRGYPDVYVLGDCSYFEDPLTSKPISPRAHNAVRQAKVVAHNIIALLRSEEKRRYDYTDSAEIISLGRSKALLRLNRNWIYGLPAILLFVLSYSLLAVGAKNRVRIILDWLMARFYGPDITLVE